MNKPTIFITVTRLWDALGEKSPTDFLVNVADIMSVDSDEWSFRADDGFSWDSPVECGKIRIRGMKSDDFYRIVQTPVDVDRLRLAAQQELA